MTSDTRVTVLVLNDRVVQQLVRGRQLAVDEPGEVGGGVAATIQYSTVQYIAVQYSTVQCTAVQYSTVQYLEEVQLSRTVSPSL